MTPEMTATIIFALVLTVFMFGVWIVSLYGKMRYNAEMHKAQQAGQMDAYLGAIAAQISRREREVLRLRNSLTLLVATYAEFNEATARRNHETLIRQIEELSWPRHYDGRGAGTRHSHHQSQQGEKDD